MSWVEFYFGLLFEVLIKTKPYKILNKLYKIKRILKKQKWKLKDWIKSSLHKNYKNKMRFLSNLPLN